MENFVTANIFDNQGRLLAVFVAWSATQAELTFRNSAHYQPGYSMACYDRNGITVSTCVR